MAGRDRYEHRRIDQIGSRNGYETGRIRSAEGAIKVRVSQVRDTDEPYCASLMSFLTATPMCSIASSPRCTHAVSRRRGRLQRRHRRAAHLQVRPLRDHRPALGGLPGLRRPGDLSEIEVEYLFCEAIFESLRRQGALEALLVAWCIDSSGRGDDGG